MVGFGDVLRFLSKKNDVWFPKLKPVPVMGTEKENHTSWERYYRVSDCSLAQRARASFCSAVDIREPRPFHRTAEDGELLPKSNILESQLATSLEGRDESANKRQHHAGMVPADRRLIKFGARG